MAEDSDYIFKALAIGDGGCGKTALCVQFSQGYFQENYKLTIGVEFFVKTIKVKDYSVKLQIWDTGGQERFQYVRPMYYKGAMGAVLLFDITNRESFDHLQKWMEEVASNVGSPIPLLLVGNKADLDDQRQVTRQEAKQYAADNGMIYMESSAKTAFGVGDVFGVLALLMIGEEIPDEMLNQGGSEGAAETPEAEFPTEVPEFVEEEPVFQSVEAPKPVFQSVEAPKPVFQSVEAPKPVFQSTVDDESFSANPFEKKTEMHTKPLFVTQKPITNQPAPQLSAIPEKKSVPAVDQPKPSLSALPEKKSKPAFIEQAQESPKPVFMPKSAQKVEEFFAPAVPERPKPAFTPIPSINTPAPTKLEFQEAEINTDDLFGDSEEDIEEADDKFFAPPVPEKKAESAPPPLVFEEPETFDDSDFISNIPEPQEVGKKVSENAPNPFVVDSKKSAPAIEAFKPKTTGKSPLFNPLAPESVPPKEKKADPFILPPKDKVEADSNAKPQNVFFQQSKPAIPDLMMKLPEAKNLNLPTAKPLDKNGKLDKKAQKELQKKEKERIKREKEEKKKREKELKKKKLIECPECKAELPKKFKFCNKCGAKI